MSLGIDRFQRAGVTILAAGVLVVTVSCNQSVKAKESSGNSQIPEVGVVSVARKNLERTLVV